MKDNLLFLVILVDYTVVSSATLLSTSLLLLYVSRYH
jgi:hypothetical protein